MADTGETGRDAFVGGVFPGVFEPLAPGEKRLLGAAARGVECAFGAAAPPEDAAQDDGRRVDAGFLRALLTAEDVERRVHDSGLRIRGALVAGRLDLTGCRLLRAVSLVSCRFTHPVILDAARCLTLRFDGSAAPGLFLRGARIDGDLSLRGLSVSGAGDAAAQQATDAEAAISANRAQIAGALDLTGLELRSGALDLAEARARILSLTRHDVMSGFTSMDSDAGPRSVILDGLTYERLPPELTAEPWVLQRLLMLQPRAHLGAARRRDLRFETAQQEDDVPDTARPRSAFRLENRLRHQPFAALIHASSAMGNYRTARRIALFRERRRLWARGEFSAPARLAHWLFGLAAGYGYRPWRPVALLATLWLSGAALSWEAYHRGGFAPADAKVLLGEAWRKARADAELDRSAGLAWSVNRGTPAPALRFARANPTYPRFDALGFSADLVLPLADFGQANAWRPDPSTRIGRVLGFARYVFVGLGALFAGLAAFCFLVSARGWRCDG